MRRGDRDADSVASGDSKRSWGMGRGVTPIGDAASGRSARGDAVSESAASASSTGSWMRKGTRRLASPPQSAVDPLRSNARGAPRAVSRFARSDGTIESSNDVSRIVFVNHHHHRSIRRRIESIAVALERKRLTETRAHRERAFTPPVTDRVSPIAEFGFKPRVLTDSDPASPKRAPHASASRRDAAAAAAVDFEVRENARLALELKQEELVKLRRRLSATEEALREGAERNAELETRLSEREGREVEAEAAALNSSLAAAMRDVRGFFSAGGKVDAAKTDQSHKDARGNARAFANGQSHDHGVLRSGLKKSASKSRASRDGGSTDANERRGVTFLAESEQKRLEEEGGYVAKLRVKTAENEDLEARLLASETSLERKREQMRVAKASYEALQKRLEEETRRREAAERALDDSAKSRVAVSDGPNEHATKATKTKHLLRDVLALTAHACGVTGRADSRAITAALPALAALARAGPGEWRANCSRRRASWSTSRMRSRRTRTMPRSRRASARRSPRSSPARAPRRRRDEARRAVTRRGSRIGGADSRARRLARAREAPIQPRGVRVRVRPASRLGARELTRDDATTKRHLRARASGERGRSVRTPPSGTPRTRTSFSSAARAHRVVWSSTRLRDAL